MIRGVANGEVPIQGAHLCYCVVEADIRCIEHIFAHRAVGVVTVRALGQVPRQKSGDKQASGLLSHASLRI